MSIENNELTRQFPALDSLRAVGSLAVLVTHVAFWSGGYTRFGVVGPILARMDVGVALFFVLSGFLLSRQWLVRAQHGSGRPAIGTYVLKRVLRIWPVYVVAVVLALTFLEENKGRGPTEWLTTLLMLDIYVGDHLPAGLSQMWSLATEVAFYVVLPLLMLLLIPRRGPARPAGTAVLVVMMTVLSVLWVTALAEHLPTDTLAGQWLPAYTSWFAVGIGLAHLQVRHAAGVSSMRTRTILAFVSSSPGALWAVAGGLVLVAATPLAGPTLLTAPTNAEAVTKNLLYAVIGGLLVASAVFNDASSGYMRVMCANWARHLGHISYGVFCIHLPVLHFVMWATGFELFQGNLLPILALTTALSLLLAEVLYRCVELPFMRRATVRRGRTARSKGVTSEKSIR